MSPRKRRVPGARHANPRDIRDPLYGLLATGNREMITHAVIAAHTNDAFVLAVTVQVDLAAFIEEVLNVELAGATVRAAVVATSTELHKEVGTAVIFDAILEGPFVPVRVSTGTHSHAIVEQVLRSATGPIRDVLDRDIMRA